MAELVASDSSSARVSQGQHEMVDDAEPEREGKRLRRRGKLSSSASDEEDYAVYEVHGKTVKVRAKRPPLKHAAGGHSFA